MWNGNWDYGNGRGAGDAPANALRASNTDREAAAAVLRTHHADGRITDDEFQQRLEQSMAARTLGDLRALEADLPGPHARLGPARQRPGRGWRRGPSGLGLLPVVVAVALVSGFIGRHAAWHYGPPAYGPFGYGHVGYGHPGFGFGPLVVLAVVVLFALRRRRRYAAGRGRWV